MVVEESLGAYDIELHNLLAERKVVRVTLLQVFLENNDFEDSFEDAFRIHVIDFLEHEVFEQIVDLVVRLEREAELHDVLEYRTFYEKKEIFVCFRETREKLQNRRFLRCRFVVEVEVSECGNELRVLPNVEERSDLSVTFYNIEKKLNNNVYAVNVSSVVEFRELI